MHIRRMLCGKQNHHRRPIKMLFEILWKTLKSNPECCLNAWEHTRSCGWDVTYRKHHFLVAGPPMEDLPNTAKSVSSASKYAKESNPHARCTSTLFSCTLGTPLRSVLGMNLTYFPRPGTYFCVLLLTSYFLTRSQAFCLLLLIKTAVILLHETFISQTLSPVTLNSIFSS